MVTTLEVDVVYGALSINLGSEQCGYELQLFYAWAL